MRVLEIKESDMLIHDMTREASTDLLARSRLCRLACAREGQPYITPIHCAYDDNQIYGFTTLGQKITWMRANPLVCVLIDEINSPQDWATVIVSGRYEELSATMQCAPYRKRAHELLQKRLVWWEPGYVETVLGGKSRPMEFVYFRIQIDHISGRRGVADTVQDSGPADGLERPTTWFRRIVGRSKHLLVT